MKDKIKKEVVIGMVCEIEDKLRELDELFMNDKLDVKGDEIVENFYYNLRREILRSVSEYFGLFDG